MSISQTDNQKSNIMNALKSWTMVVITLIFVLLYCAALLGWIKPLTDERMITRLEPIIFVIIGYYFGRLPAQSNEKTLKDEVTRQTQRADAAQHAKEQAQQTREALEEKIKNVQATLSSALPTRNAKSLSESKSGFDKSNHDEPAERSIITAINILKS